MRPPHAGDDAIAVSPVDLRWRYHRYGLAFVWLDQQTMLNELLIREGFAEEVTYTDGYAHADELRAAENAARDAGAGLWSACAGEIQ